MYIENSWNDLQKRERIKLECKQTFRKTNSPTKQDNRIKIIIN